MSFRDYSDVLNRLTKFKKEIDAFLAKGDSKSALVKLAEAAKSGNDGLLSLKFAGTEIKENDEYRRQKKIAEKIYSKISFIHSGTEFDPIQKLMGFTDDNYVHTLYQGTFVASTFNEVSKRMQLSCCSYDRPNRARKPFRSLDSAAEREATTSFSLKCFDHTLGDIHRLDPPISRVPPP